ncbi:hypothetical protein RRG08_035602 [Elysia crispata]|uniref:Uncharacterized protein n=1 Tax=Elysia crispata TaxID=231223 RepID=A0AAE1B5F0_9GAST|nr:hypothetical protein RRG08_035602 [Elysia crispata]
MCAAAFLILIIGYLFLLDVAVQTDWDRSPVFDVTPNLLSRWNDVCCCLPDSDHLTCKKWHPLSPRVLLSELHIGGNYIDRLISLKEAFEIATFTHTHIPSTSSHIPSTSSHIPSTSSHIPSTSSHIPSTSSHIPSTPSPPLSLICANFPLPPASPFPDPLIPIAKYRYDVANEKMPHKQSK